jgi:hypothetical protein
MKRKIYIETSVISYLTSRPSRHIIERGHQQSTILFWEKRTKYDLVASSIVVNECNSGDVNAAKKRLDQLLHIPLLDINADCVQLAKALVNAGIVPIKASVDALHISVATIHFVDYLLTWNCKHIANPEIQARIAAYLQQKGLFLPFICTPDELIGEDDED